MIYRNPNVLKLIEQATEHYQSYSYERGNYKSTELNKWTFAELIVKECMKVVDDLEGSYYIPWVNEAIKKHFGLEEDE